MAIMGPMRVLSDFLLMQETEREMQESGLARWARRQRSRIQWGLKDGEEWSGREDLNLRPPWSRTSFRRLLKFVEIA